MSVRECVREREGVSERGRERREGESEIHRY